MKFFLSLCLVFSAAFIFCSCKTSHIIKNPGPTDTVATTNKDARRAKIWITQGDTATKELVMVYNGHGAKHVKAWSSQIIKWKIADGANVKTIKNIDRESGDTVFAIKPFKRSDKKWKGKLKKKITGDPPEEEEYFIEWTDENNNSHTYDPYMQVNPR